MEQVAEALNGTANTVVRRLDGGIFYASLPDGYGVDEMVAAVEERFGKCDTLMYSSNTIGVRLSGGIIATFLFEPRG